MTDLDETRLRLAIDAMYDLRHRNSPVPTSTKDLARAAVEAYLADPGPAWPSDESVHEAYGCGSYASDIPRVFGIQREALRAAFLADPVIKAAVAWTKRRQDLYSDETYADFCTDLEEAVWDAGLLDG